MLLQVVWVLGVATLLAVWCGWGLARLTLPPSLDRWRGLLAPLMGYSLVLVVGSAVARDLTGMRGMLVVLLPAAGVLNLLAWRRTGPPRFPRSPRDLLGALPLALLLLATLWVGVAPVANYGHEAVIGQNWDPEFYLPLAYYLERGPVQAISSAPANPLRDYTASPSALGVTPGFTLWQASVDALARLDPVATFVPILAWLRALGVAAVYVLFRATLGLRPGYALLGASFVSAGGLLLWTTYFSFGQQLAAWPLIPACLLVGIESARHLAAEGRTAWPALVGAAVVVASLPLAYYPGLTVFLPLGMGLGVAVLLEARERRKLLLAAGAIAGAAALVMLPALPGLLDYYQGFSARYDVRAVTLGLASYIPLTHIVGLTPFALTQEGTAAVGNVPAEAVAAFGLLCALMLAGLARGAGRARWIGLLLGACAYIAWLRWVEQYPYAYLKGSTYMAFPLLGLAAAGAQAIANLQLRWGRALAVSLGVGLLLFMGVVEYQVVKGYWSKPALYRTELPDLLALRTLVPEGARVTVSHDGRLVGPRSGILAYMLTHAEILGALTTGYVQGWSHGTLTTVGDYALLLPDEDPESYGFAYEARVAGMEHYALYHKTQVSAHLGLDRTLAPGEQLELGLGSSEVVTGTLLPTGGEARQAAMSVVSLGSGRVMLGGEALDVPAGVSTLLTPPAATPGKVALLNTGGGPLDVRWVDLLGPGESLAGTGRAAVEPSKTSAVAAITTISGKSSLTSTIETVLPGVSNVTSVLYTLDIWDKAAGKHYGWFSVGQARTTSVGALKLSLDLESGKMAGFDSQGKKVRINSQLFDLKGGKYIARLEVRSGGQLVGSLDDVFEFATSSEGVATADLSGASRRILVFRPGPSNATSGTK